MVTGLYIFVYILMTSFSHSLPQLSRSVLDNFLSPVFFAVIFLLLAAWSSKKHHVISRSSGEAEYRGVVNDVYEETWLSNLLLELHCPLSGSTIVFCVNRVAFGHVRVLLVPSAHQFTDISAIKDFRPSYSLKLGPDGNLQLGLRDKGTTLLVGPVKFGASEDTLADIVASLSSNSETCFSETSFEDAVASSKLLNTSPSRQNSPKRVPRVFCGVLTGNAYSLSMEKGLLGSGRRGGGHNNNNNKNNNETCSLKEAATVGNHATAGKHINDIERQMLEGKLVLVGYDGLPLKPMNDDGQTTIMDHFPWLSDTFGTPNTTTKVAMADTRYTSSNNREDGLVNVIESDKLNGMRPVSYANHINDEPSMIVANLRTLIALAGNGADVAVSLDSVLEDKERYENSVYRMLENEPWLICNVLVILRKWSPLVNVSQHSRRMDRVSSFARGMIDLHTDVELKDTLVVTVPKIKDMASSSGTKIVTLNPFDVLNMVDKDIRDAPSDTVNSKADDVNVGNIKVISVYDDNPYDDDVGHEDITEEQLGFFDAFDISLRGQNRC
ncbi:hypothetical protein Tco_0060239 [Tanacetum coccineum]